MERAVGAQYFPCISRLYGTFGSLNAALAAKERIPNVTNITVASINVSMPLSQQKKESCVKGIYP